MTNGKARIRDCRRRGDGIGVAIERQQPAIRTELPQHSAGVPASSEGRIEINAISPHVQSCNRLFHHHWRMHRADRQSENPSSSGGKPPLLNETAAAVTSFQRASSQISNLLPCPTSTICLSSPDTQVTPRT